jgi:hypothetical protein
MASLGKAPLEPLYWHEALASSPLWRLISGFFVCGFSLAIISTHFVAFATERGTSPAVLISYASQYVTLMPGDGIYTGTPTLLPEKTRIMKDGDVVEVEIQPIGVLRNRVVAMKPGASSAPAGGHTALYRCEGGDQVLEAAKGTERMQGMFLHHLCGFHETAVGIGPTTDEEHPMWDEHRQQLGVDRTQDAPGLRAP